MKELLENNEFVEGIAVGVSLYQNVVLAAHERKEPLKIGAEVIEWEGHSPEILNTMLENLKKLSEQGIKAID